MKTFRHAALAGLLVLAASAAQAARADYYTGWHKHPTSNYYYCSHYFAKAGCHCTSYQREYVLYYPQRPQYMYYYDPVRRACYARAPLTRPAPTLEGTPRPGLDQFPEEVPPVRPRPPFVTPRPAPKVAPPPAETKPAVPAPDTTADKEAEELPADDSLPR